MSPESAQKIPRRRILADGLALIGALTAFTIVGGIRLRGEHLIYENISEDVRGEILKFQFKTVAHNGANTAERLRVYGQTNSDFIEVDVFTHNGRQFVGHEDYHGPIAWDKKDLFIKAGNPGLTLEYVIREVSEDGKMFFIDCKDSRSVAPTIRYMADKGYLLHASFTSTAWPLLDEIAIFLESYENLFFTLQDENGYRRFFEERGVPGSKFGVSLDKKLANAENIEKLKAAGATVFVYGINWASEALSALKAGADGITTDNVDLLSLQSTQL